MDFSIRLEGRGTIPERPHVFGEVAGATGGNVRPAVLSVLVFFVGGGLLLASVKAGGPTTGESE